MANIQKSQLPSGFERPETQVGLKVSPLWASWADLWGFHILSHKQGQPSTAALGIRFWLRVRSCSGRRLECQGHSSLGLPTALGVVHVPGSAGDTETHSFPQRSSWSRGRGWKERVLLDVTVWFFSVLPVSLERPWSLQEKMRRMRRVSVLRRRPSRERPQRRP